MIQEKVNEYIDLCSKLNNSIYTVSHASVRRHNTAMSREDNFELEISKQPDLAKEVFKRLLENEDKNVQRHAAAACLLKLGIYAERAVNILEEIYKGDHRFAAFEAEAVLMVWRKQIPCDKK